MLKKARNDVLVCALSQILPGYSRKQWNRQRIPAQIFGEANIRRAVQVRFHSYMNEQKNQAGAYQSSLQIPRF